MCSCSSCARHCILLHAHWNEDSRLPGIHWCPRGPKKDLCFLVLSASDDYCHFLDNSDKAFEHLLSSIFSWCDLGRFLMVIHSLILWEMEVLALFLILLIIRFLSTVRWTDNSPLFYPPDKNPLNTLDLKTWVFGAKLSFYPIIVWLLPQGNPGQLLPVEYRLNIDRHNEKGQCAWFTDRHPAWSTYFEPHNKLMKWVAMLSFFR